MAQNSHDGAADLLSLSWGDFLPFNAGLWEIETCFFGPSFLDSFFDPFFDPSVAILDDWGFAPSWAPGHRYSTGHRYSPAQRFQPIPSTRNGAFRTAQSASESRPGPNPPKSHSCPIPRIGRLSEQLEDPKNYTRTHARELPYICTLCNKCFSRAEDLTLHRHLHETRASGLAPSDDITVECRAPDEVESGPEDVPQPPATHVGVRILSHTGAGPLPSPPLKSLHTPSQSSPPVAQLSASAGHPSGLPQENDHVSKRLPRTSKGYACKQPTCKKTFDTRAQMNKHYRSHIPEHQRNFKCSDCSKGFNDARDLKRHIDGKNRCKERNNGYDPGHRLSTPAPESTATPSEPSNGQPKSSDDLHQFQLPTSPLDERIDECIQALRHQADSLSAKGSVVSGFVATFVPIIIDSGKGNGTNPGERLHVYIPSEELVPT